MKLPTLPANPTSKLLFILLKFTGGLPKLKLAYKWEVNEISPGSNPQPTKVGGLEKTNFTLVYTLLPCISL